MTEHIYCASCGVEFCLPTEFATHRRRDHDTFYCPNGHRNHFPGKTEEQKKIERLEGRIRTLEIENEMIWTGREELMGALKECPIPGCTWRSRKHIPRDPVAMGRGIERVRHDLLEHLVRDHAGQAIEPKLLPAG